MPKGWLWALCVTLAAGLFAAPVRADRLTVFAAASLKPVLDPIVASGCCGDVRVSYGGSGMMARQIERGAPADLAIFADPLWLARLVDQGLLVGAPVTLASNRIILAARDPAPLTLTPQALAARLGQGRLAMGDPTFVPAGRYGQIALEALGLWPVASGRAVFTDNVRAAVRFAAQGEVPLAVIYASDLHGTGLTEVAALPLPKGAPPILYQGGVIQGAGPDARALLDHLEGPVGQGAFAAAGFAPAPKAP